jgi:hypothetical protein
VSRFLFHISTKHLSKLPAFYAFAALRRRDARAPSAHFPAKPEGFCNNRYKIDFRASH